MNVCKFCDLKLRVDNKIGTCRKHRNLSDSRRKYIKQYFADNPEKVKEIKKKYAPKATERFLERRRIDPVFKLIHTLRVRLNHAINGKRKSGKTIELLGCTPQELKLHLQSKFRDGMTWKNHGKLWHIDHIYPLSKADLSNLKELKRVCHYSNLQPLLAVENMKKGNRI